MASPSCHICTTSQGSVVTEPHNLRQVAANTKLSLPNSDTFGQITISFLIIEVGSVGKDVITSDLAECNTRQLEEKF